MVGKAIYDILSNDAPVSALVGTRIFPVVASQNAANPCIVYNIDTDYEDNKDNVAKIAHAEAQIDVYTDFGEGGYAENEDLANKVITALDRYAATNNGIVIAQTLLLRREDFYDEQSNAYRTLMEFRFRINNG